MTLNQPLLYFAWTEKYCQTSPNKNKSPNLWHITSILVGCILGRDIRFFWLFDNNSIGLKLRESLCRVKEIWCKVIYHLQKKNLRRRHKNPTQGGKIRGKLFGSLVSLWRPVYGSAPFHIQPNVFQQRSLLVVPKTNRQIWNVFTS